MTLSCCITHFLGCSCYSSIPWLLLIYHCYSAQIPSARCSWLPYFCHLLNNWDPCRGAGRTQCCMYPWCPNPVTRYIRGSPLIRSSDRRDLKAPVKVAQPPHLPLTSTAALQLPSPTVCHRSLQVLLCLWTSTVVSERARRLLTALWTYSRSQSSHLSARPVFWTGPEFQEQLHQKLPLLCLPEYPLCSLKETW